MRGPATRRYGHKKYLLAADDTVRALTPELSTMPDWPKEGSVRHVDGVLLVKLSD